MPVHFVVQAFRTRVFIHFQLLQLTVHPEVQQRPSPGLDGGEGNPLGHLPITDRLFLSLQRQNHGSQVEVNVKEDTRVVHFQKVVLKWNVCFIYAHDCLVTMNPDRHQLFCCGHFTSQLEPNRKKKDLLLLLFSNK